jgi:hypothetical protein
MNQKEARGSGMPRSEESLQPSYNEAARYAFKHLYPEGLLRFLVEGVFKHWKYTGWVDSQAVSFPGDPERRCDTVARFERIDGDRLPVALVVEFETAPGSDMYPREGEYCWRLRREAPFQSRPGVPYDVVGAIVFLTGPRQPSLWRMKPDDFCDLGMVMECAVPCFRDMDVMQVVARIAGKELSPALLPFSPLMGGADRTEAAVACRDLLKQETDQRKRKDMAAVALVLANLNAKPEVWRSAFMELQMDANTSPMLVEFIGKGRSEAAAAVRSAMIAGLEQTMKTTVPDDVRKRIEAQVDVNTLASWCATSGRCASWDQVRVMVGLPAVS